MTDLVVRSVPGVGHIWDCSAPVVAQALTVAPVPAHRIDQGDE